MKKGEIIEDVYYTMEKYSYLMADIDLSMSMRWERSAAYIAGAYAKKTVCIYGRFAAS